MAGLERKVTGRFAGAVRVSVGGIEVGRVPSGEARRYLRKIWQFRDVGLPTTCRAVIAETEDHRFGRFLVQMFALPKPRVEDEPFLPPLKAVPVHQDGGLTGLIEQTLARHGGDQVITNTGELSLRNNAWRVSLDGESIGSLMPRAYVHLHEAEAAGCPLTCGIRINRSLRVTALIPPD